MISLLIKQYYIVYNTYPSVSLSLYIYGCTFDIYLFSYFTDISRYIYVGIQIRSINIKTLSSIVGNNCVIETKRRLIWWFSRYNQLPKYGDRFACSDLSPIHTYFLVRNSCFEIFLKCNITNLILSPKLLWLHSNNWNRDTHTLSFSLNGIFEVVLDVDSRIVSFYNDKKFHKSFALFSFDNMRKSVD